MHFNIRVTDWIIKSIMKLVSYYTFLLTLTALITSCGEDRTGEYNLLIAEKIYMEETLKSHYLWYDEMPTPTEKDYFNTPEVFFPKLLFKGNSSESADKYSYLEVDEAATRSYLKRNATYGFDFELFTDPTQTTTRLFARVLYVLPNSPASQAGIERGDWISGVGSSTLTSNNYSLLTSGDATRFARELLVENEGLLNWQSKDTVAITSARTVELNPFYLDTLYQVANQKIAYLVYNEFSTGPTNGGSETAYTTQMKEIFARFKQEAPDAFILDLRYNPGGYVHVAMELASLLAPQTALGETFVQLKYNDKSSPQVVPWKLNETAPENLNLQKIYILTTGFTASASELIIHCLKPYMGQENVVVLGDVTEGKNLAMAGYTKADVTFTMWPVVAYTEDVTGNSEYGNGITPTFSLIENRNYQPLLPLGSTDEYLLRNTLSYITTGVVPDIATAETASRVWYSSLQRRAVPANLIHTPGKE